MSHRAFRALLLLVPAALLLAACETEPLGTGLPEKTECNSCHGNSQNAAPPRSVEGATATSEVGVGAHQAHLLDGRLRKPIACEECHVVPDSVGDQGHVDPLPAEVTFGELAKSDGANPVWDRETRTCANSYCHGSTVSGGDVTAPEWTKIDGSQVTCGSCHGNPPPTPHPQSSACQQCHGETVNADGTINVEAGNHINGSVQVEVEGCDSCHGSGGIAAPPIDLEGNTVTTAPGVGAHRQHLGESDWHAELACAECHVVPDSADAPGHIDDPPAELTFGELASTGGATPSYDRASTSCSGSYCHGSTLPVPAQGSATAPDWTVVDGSQDTCGSCHGNPPGGQHPDRTDCASCHGAVVSSDGSFVAPSLHINGSVEVAGLGCDACHGGNGNPAPPVDLQGNTAKSFLGVGAHRDHLGDSDWHKEVTCATCHVVPATVDAPGHIDDAPAEIVWGGVATAQGANPTWDRAAATCSNSYCHGATVDGGTLPTPVWTDADDGELACTSCHGMPPGGDHPPRPDCATCHGGVIGADGTFVDAAKHIDGTVDIEGLTCASCHGSNGNPAPPVDVTGNTETTVAGVGAHRKHVDPSSWHKTVACSACHLVPSSNDAPGHADTPLPAELTWSGLAVTGGATPTYDSGAMTCSGSYCHGSTLSGGLLGAPVWTEVTDDPLACTSCHGMPPTENHPPRTDCASCHGAVVDAAGTIVAPELHIDGEVNLETLGCNSCHGNDVNAAPPVDVSGGSDTTTASVGAHQAHLVGGSWHKPVACSDCHVVPAAIDAEGHADTALPAELTWSALAAQGTTPQWDTGATTCSGTYCHGSTLSGGSNTTPDWTVVDGAQAACGTCHGLPPTENHVPRTDCESCHGEVVDATGIVNGALHIDGQVQVIALGCNGCHGSDVNPAPPVDVTGNAETSARGVGAHQQHLAESDWHAEVACADCHKVPTAVGDEGHMDTALPAELVWGSLATTNNLNPAFSDATLACSNTYCHGGSLSGGANTAPVWTDVDATPPACTSCHGMPPTVGHPASATCVDCHGCVTMPDNLSINPAQADMHINGQTNFGVVCP